MGVFKLDDIYPEIEGIMGLNKGEGRVYIREMLEEFDAGPGRENKKEGANVRYPIFDLAFSPEPGHVQAYLSYGGLCASFGRGEWVLRDLCRWDGP